jgi:tRNA (mo5U34)-methyltransferase
MAGDELRRQVGERSWYHTLELAPGVVTPGWFDTRGVLRSIPFPADLSGMRCLDIATFDGFWAFEMERRGAAEVVAVDVLDPRDFDWPDNSTADAVDAIGERKGLGEGFEIAAAALGSSVKRLERNVYDLDPAELGTFDFIYMGSLLLHLRDPIRALGCVRRVCAGSALFVDAVDAELSLLFRRRAVAGFDGMGRPWWWKPNAAALARFIESAGFSVVEGPGRFSMPRGEGQPLVRPAWRALGSHVGREAWLTWRRGDPHAYVVGTPG